MDINKVIGSRLDSVKELLKKKNKEYSYSSDYFANFDDGSDFGDCSREYALWMYLVKHLSSLKKIVLDTNDGIYADISLVEEKVGDAIAYLVLLEAMMKDREEENENERDVNDIVINYFTER